MQLNRNFDRATRMKANSELRKARDQYKQADNQPGDQDPRPDRVTLQSEGQTVQALLNGSSFIERFENAEGVTIGTYKVAEWYDPFTTATGMEVQNNGQSTGGSTLEYHLGWTSAYHHHADLSTADAEANFAALNQHFQPDSKA